jgi:hypothetical protein
MEGVAIIARLKEGSGQRVAELVGEPFHAELQRALDQWRKIDDGQPRIARERFGWELDEAEPVATPAGDRSESWA